MQSHETCENVVRNTNKELEEGSESSRRFGGSITHPQNEVAFLFFVGFALPGTPQVLMFFEVLAFFCFGGDVSDGEEEKEQQEKRKNN